MSNVTLEDMYKMSSVLASIDREIMLCDDVLQLEILAQLMLTRSKLILDTQVGKRKRKRIFNEINLD